MKRVDRNVLLITIFILFFSHLNIFSEYPQCKEIIKKKSIYGKTSKLKYLTGRFNPKKHPLFVSLKKAKIPTNKYKHHYLRKDVCIQLKIMLAAFKKDNPRVKLIVTSSTRNFYVQKYIWESKFKGKRKVAGKNLKKTIKDPLKRARRILKYSSMPGTSRHHWGTDFDFNTLTAKYWKSKKGQIIYNWLKKNASNYGFCQPYTSDRSAGYEEERWHWSYLPVSKKFLKDWNIIYKKNPKIFSKKKLFAGSRSAGHLAPIYVNSIGDSCK